MTKREISPDELESVFRLAAVYPDLRTLETELTELRQRVAKLSRLAIGGDPVQPKSVSDLLRLEKAGLLTRAQVGERLGLSGPCPLAQGAPLGASKLQPTTEPAAWGAGLPATVVIPTKDYESFMKIARANSWVVGIPAKEYAAKGKPG